MRKTVKQFAGSLQLGAKEPAVTALRSSQKRENK